MSIFGEKAVKQRRRVSVGILVVAACLVGFVGGRVSFQWQYPITKEATFRNLSYAYKEIMNNYLNGADSKALIEGAAEGMVASLDDPYSMYLSGDKGEQYMKSYEDHFVGIGIEIREQDGDFIIEDTIKGAPAEKSGLKSGDTFITVDGKKTKGITLAELKQLVQGKEGTVAKLMINREGLKEPLEVSVTRGAVPVHTVASHMDKNNIGEIDVTRFAEKTDEEFKEALDSLQKQGMKGLLIDLRGNPGGLLDPTIQIAQNFVPKGKVIVQVVYKGEKQIITHKSEQTTPWKVPIAILVDAHTASSAEVLTAALKDTAGATVIGEKTFGKGIVQNFRQLKDGSVLKLTEAQWRSPNGQWIHKKGIVPTVRVEAPAYAELPRLPAGLHLKAGDYGEKVQIAQTMLQTLGYNVGVGKGIYDTDTAEAVKKFQRDEALPNSGVLNDKSAYRITLRLTEKFKAQDPQRNKALALLEAAEK
ncbi:carboxy-terminal processing protease CtpA [Paenibacillus baekrokdamisoli]|uniref:Carboxy-terminal processing protease CtpA n=1 Tax=Paenibacillus baekrokdamisoli TaxID=1712516 RepID=A0A3G9J8W2_9BACL|nr:S41 family peptidase [Paenibacillus baekrokdamisoli]MBB3072212.1 carboxyl-terminal processing protease [Paenibacillus baekrokdamisoli]BBH24795.1 carboxy-terminal processing protease CtpA [Paenibacillus baekrokdamisoli]